MKKCGKCKIDKSDDSFHKNSKTKTGLSSSCKQCESERKKNSINAINYRIKNRDRILEYKKEYRKKSFDKRKQYKIDNKEHIKKQSAEYVKEKRKNDPLFNLAHNIRVRVSEIFEKNGYTKKSRTHDILGCSFEEFKIYLETKFEPWMSWDNKGNPKDGILTPNKSWDIDHIIPLASATNEEELIKLCHYSNLQPLCSYYNRIIKKDK